MQTPKFLNPHDKFSFVFEIRLRFIHGTDSFGMRPVYLCAKVLPLFSPHLLRKLRLTDKKYKHIKNSGIFRAREWALNVETISISTFFECFFSNLSQIFIF